VVRAAFRERLGRFLAGSTGSSTRIAKAVLIDTPLLIDRGEVTDKGSVNQRAVLEHRAGLIEAIYAGDADARVIAV
jgi:feruloyl-CoA synthase